MSTATAEDWRIGQRQAPQARGTYFFDSSLLDTFSQPTIMVHPVGSLVLHDAEGRRSKYTLQTDGILHFTKILSCHLRSHAPRRSQMLHGESNSFAYGIKCQYWFADRADEDVGQAELRSWIFLQERNGQNAKGWKTDEEAQMRAVAEHPRREQVTVCQPGLPILPYNLVFKEHILQSISGLRRNNISARFQNGEPFDETETKSLADMGPRILNPGTVLPWLIIFVNLTKQLGVPSSRSTVDPCLPGSRVWHLFGDLIGNQGPNPGGMDAHGSGGQGHPASAIIVYIEMSSSIGECRECHSQFPQVVGASRDRDRDQGSGRLTQNDIST
ncbi:hypothetical protein SODALDRAFT_357029 [Sodiomyces alkalinus F11]|uniref:Uncharacterized protein n=1 Tax=Sodiomyces alkalinus (strain CBS 110278 / VKM F-3762 / F11) TaxID=1314773 RepID=A0A3N2Q2P3_SODAK|nr:hypothetical protein SODALDRAFT_357029 [Sodiomyces alkalinus F11]ROT41002.1 hypothetical protein SODALDRAFT_357029 [Sodiomyces alkalinus F11]